MIENEIGVQKIKSVGDCDNLITVNCIDECGKIYGDRISSPHQSGYQMPTNYGTYSTVGPTSYATVMSLCRMPLDTSYYYAEWFDYYYYYTFVFSSQSECTQECGLWQVGTSSISSKDCSCGTLSLCTCDTATFSAPERRVTNSATCKTYFENKDLFPYFGGDIGWGYSYPIKQCDGTLKKVEECKDMITLIGTFGGYVSLIYSAVGFIFFIAISKARFIKLEKKVNKNSEDIEAEMTPFNTNSDDGTYVITRQNDEYSNKEYDDEDCNEDNDDEDSNYDNEDNDEDEKSIYGVTENIE